VCADQVLIGAEGIIESELFRGPRLDESHCAGPLLPMEARQQRGYRGAKRRYQKGDGKEGKRKKN